MLMPSLSIRGGVAVCAAAMLPTMISAIKESKVDLMSFPSSLAFRHKCSEVIGCPTTTAARISSTNSTNVSRQILLPRFQLLPPKPPEADR
jgi:hypothetical protein